MSYDTLITDGRVVDGTGNPWFHADVGITKGKITKVGRLDPTRTAKTLDATGLVICPGFIDLHNHSDFSLLFDPRFESTIRQGITTAVIGNCGESIAPINPERKKIFRTIIARHTPPGEDVREFPWHYFGEYLDEMEKIPCSTNIVPLIGFSPVRISGGPGYEDRPPTSEELAQMRAYIDEGMRAGAFGMSTGLIYTPQRYAKTEEILELAKVVTKYKGIYFSHIRGESESVIDAVKECIAIVEKEGCVGGQIGHHKIAGKPNWGASKETLRLIEEANARGVNITVDQYPYNRAMTSLITVLPPWMHLGGVEALLERLQDPDNQERIKKELEAGIVGSDNYIKNIGFGGIYIAAVKSQTWREMEGKSLAEITLLKGNADNWQTLFDLLLDEKAEVSITVEMMDEADIRRIMQGRYTAIATDGWAVSPTGILGYGKPHPRFYGTFPRILGRYVREEGILVLEDAIRRMTSFPAQILGLWDRGLVRKGMWADLVLFDPKTIKDKATYENPHQFPEGIPYVLVNGDLVVESNQQTDKLPGTLIRRNT